MKKIFTLCCALLCLSTVNAQVITNKDCVRLKDGTVVEGTVARPLNGINVKVTLDDGRQRIYAIDEIDKIYTISHVSKAPTPHLLSYTEQMKKEPWRPRGYRGFFEAGMATAMTHKDIAYQVTTSHGFQADPNYYMGIGVSYTYNQTRDWTFLPVFGNLRFHLTKGRISPFVDVKAGYSITKIQGGYANLSLGCHYSISRNLGINASLGYDMQQFIDKTDGTEHTGYIHSLNAKIGIDF